MFSFAALLRPGSRHAFALLVYVLSAGEAHAQVGIVAPPVTIVDTTPASSVAHPDLVAVGDTIRIFQNGIVVAHGVIGEITSINFLVQDAYGASSRYTRTAIGRAEVQRGERRRGARSMLKGAGIGAGIGAGLITLAVITAEPRDEGIGIIVSIMAAGASTVIGTIAGGVTALTWTENWQPFDPITLRVLLAPS